MKITILAPVALLGRSPSSAIDLTSSAFFGHDLRVQFLDQGPPSIEGAFDEASAVAEIVAKAVQAEAEGAQAVVIDCVLDPGLEAAREKVSIPVVGPGQAAMHLACLLADRFSIVTVLKALAPSLRRRAELYGLASRLASVRAIDVPVLALLEGRAACAAPLTREAVLAVEEDGAEAVVLGCTGMAGLASPVTDELRRRGLPPIPVIDPRNAALVIAAGLVGMELTHSRLTYPVPGEKAITGCAGL